MHYFYVVHTHTHTHQREREAVWLTLTLSLSTYVFLWLTFLKKRPVCWGEQRPLFFSEKMAALRDIGRGRESVKERMSYS